MPLLRGYLEKRGGLDDAGVADHDVERVDSGQRRFDRRPIGDVCSNVVAAELHEPVGDRNAVDGRHARAARCQLARHRETEVAGGAGDGDAEGCEVVLSHVSGVELPAAVDETRDGQRVSALLRGPAGARPPRRSQAARARPRRP